MEKIYLDKKIENENIKEKFVDLFSDLTVFYYDFNDDTPKELDFTNSRHIFFNSEYCAEKLEFGFVVSIYGTTNDDDQERTLFIAKSFSDFFGVRVLVPYTNPANPYDPYYDIIFEKGKIFLAEDSDTSFGDGTSGLVNILEEYPLKITQFDGKGGRKTPGFL
eukprot:gene17784-21214_t